MRPSRIDENACHLFLDAKILTERNNERLGHRPLQSGDNSYAATVEFVTYSFSACDRSFSFSFGSGSGTYRIFSCQRNFNNDTYFR